jgi:hypothetical protein
MVSKLTKRRRRMLHLAGSPNEALGATFFIAVCHYSTRHMDGSTATGVARVHP